MGNPFKPNQSQISIACRVFTCSSIVWDLYSSAHMNLLAHFKIHQGQGRLAEFKFWKGFVSQKVVPLATAYLISW